MVGVCAPPGIRGAPASRPVRGHADARRRKRKGRGGGSFPHAQARVAHAAHRVSVRSHRAAAGQGNCNPVRCVVVVTRLPVPPAPSTCTHAPRARLVVHVCACDSFWSRARKDPLGLHEWEVGTMHAHIGTGLLCLAAATALSSVAVVVVCSFGSMASAELARVGLRRAVRAQACKSDPWRRRTVRAQLVAQPVCRRVVALPPRCGPARR